MNAIGKSSRFALSLFAAVLLMAALLAPAPVRAAADSIMINQVFSIAMQVYIPCAAGGLGETVFLYGNLHDVYHITYNSAGGYRLHYSYNPQGISGLGDITGTKYQATGITLGGSTGQLGYEETFVNNFRIIGAGTDNNFLVHETFHITINADGTVTASHDNFSVECK